MTRFGCPECRSLNIDFISGWECVCYACCHRFFAMDVLMEDKDESPDDEASE